MSHASLHPLDSAASPPLSGGAPAPKSARAPLPTWRKTRDRMDGMSLGIEMGLSVVLGWYLGTLVDDHFETAPWGMAFFLLAGLIAAGKAVYRFYRQAKAVMSAPEPGEVVAAQVTASSRPPRGGVR